MDGQLISLKLLERRAIVFVFTFAFTKWGNAQNDLVAIGAVALNFRECKIKCIGQVQYATCMEPCQRH